MKIPDKMIRCYVRDTGETVKVYFDGSDVYRVIDGDRKPTIFFEPEIGKSRLKWAWALAAQMESEDRACYAAVIKESTV